jgi:hypothetical protein
MTKIQKITQKYWFLIALLSMTPFAILVKNPEWLSWSLLSLQIFFLAWNILALILVCKDKIRVF